MVKRLGLILALVLTLPALAQAQSWPMHENTYVNDYANVIDEAAETRIRRQLEVLRTDTGIEATVLTIHTRKGYSISGSLEDFATGLFNNWGIGDASKNDGILILVVSEDRDMRIELGSGYARDFNRAAGDVIDGVFLPAFKAGDMSLGIEQGTDATIKRIANVFAEGGAPEVASKGINFAAWMFGGFAVLFTTVFGSAIFGRRIKDRFSRCPSCGERGIHTEKHETLSATRKSKGQGERITTCTHCDHRATSFYIIPVRSSSSSSSSGGSFGGGSSSGGGASGSW